MRRTGGVYLAVLCALASGCGDGALPGARPTRTSELVGFPGIPGPPAPEALDGGAEERDGSTSIPPATQATGGDPALAARLLVLYDTTGASGPLGELYAQYVANLAGHFGTWIAKPVASYAAGDIDAATATVYIGSSDGEPLPTAFLDDVLASKRPVLWIYDNIDQLVARAGADAFRNSHGWDTFAVTSYAGCPAPRVDCSPVNSIEYKGQSLPRDGVNNASGIIDYAYLDTKRVDVLATAVRDDGTRFPWAVRSVNLTYVGELPFPYARENDRVLVFCDLLFDALAPRTPTRHRALLRVEDVSAASDPAQLRALADWLAGEGVPFSVSVIPVYVDPLGYYNGGVPETRPLHSNVEIVSALQYAQSRGGTLLLHGETHQYGSLKNALSGASGDDFELYLAHVDAARHVQLDGPTATDSAAWAAGRLAAALDELGAAGLEAPAIFETPHYAASVADYGAIAARFGARYERSVYFGGRLTGRSMDRGPLIGQFFPYPVVDVYGTKVIPENLGDLQPEAFLDQPPRLPADLVAAAHSQLVVRDGVASAFVHVTDPIASIQEVVDGVRALGYTFVAAGSL